MTFVELAAPATRTAIKPHSCDWCGPLTILAGELYVAWFGIADGDAFAGAMHVDCFAVAESTIDPLDDEGQWCGDTYPHPRGATCDRCSDLPR